MRRMRNLCLAAFILFAPIISWSQFSLGSPNYSQDFNGLGTVTSTAVAGGNLNNVSPTLNGWFFLETLANNNTTITAGFGSSNIGDTYNFGTLLATDRTLGGLQSNMLLPFFGFYFTNNSGGIITSLAITYTGEQWRIGTTGRFDGLDFQYSYNATSLSTGTWSDFNPLDFTAPINSGAPGQLDGNLPPNRTTITNTISGLNIPIGSTFFIRWKDSDASGADDGLGIDDLSFTAGFTPASTDYFRSKASGNWDLTSTWESAPDNASWVNATSVPTPAANTITIRNGHTVSITAVTSADQLVIQNGGMLDHVTGNFNITDGVGDDVIIENGGVLVLSSSISRPAFSSTLARVNINTGGKLRLSASGLTGAGAGVNDSTYVYQHQSILEWTLGSGFSFSTSGVTYFPNVDAVTIPIFRTTNATPIIVGGTGNTIFNGIFQSDGATVNWTNSGTKAFRNGITGTGTMDGSGVVQPSGKFIINGTTANLGGSGSLLLPAGGMDIGNGTTITMTSAKTVTGNITFLSNSYIDLGTNNLTVAGDITGGGSNAFVRTDGIGTLTFNNVTGKTFPIGTGTSYNPLVFSNGGGLNYSARVEVGINPIIAFPTYGINRTWNIRASSNAAGVNVTFQYESSHANVNVIVPEAMELLQNDGIAWSIIPGNGNLPTLGTGPYTNAASSLGIASATSTPYALGKKGGYILPIDCIISCRSRKINNSGNISWEINSCAQVISFEIQRSVNSGSFQTIGTVFPGTQLIYNYTDARLLPGNNFYRIKVNRSSGSTKYSNTVAVINDNKGVLITSISPNPVKDKATIIVSAAKKETINFAITDYTGRIVKKWQTVLNEGSNAITMNVGELAGGLYHITALTGDAKTTTPFVLIKQE